MENRDGFEFWYLAGKNAAKLARGPFKTPFGTAANWCFKRALRHSNAREKGAIRRDRAELLSRLGRFKEAQQQVRLSANLLAKTGDESELQLTQITRAAVYCRWALSLEAGKHQSDLLCTAYESISRALDYFSHQGYTPQEHVIACLWLTTICLGLYIDEGDEYWMAKARSANEIARALAIGYTPTHIALRQYGIITEWQKESA